ncbi:MAG: bifunctional methylenetetrahydrofolate dehydrogenase/methenyltetrahydrofolate cyclohydrolase FolD [Candidatus Micrarchaeota archaeon]
MTAHLLDGKAASLAWQAELGERIKSLPSPPCLALVRVGEDPASGIYVRKKTEMCGRLGIRSELIHLPEKTTQKELLSRIESLNADKTVNGILVQVPLPKQIDALAIQQAIHPLKDADGFGPESMGLLLMGRPRFIAATPAGIMRLLSHYHLSPAGKHAVVVGRSNIVGKPIAQLLLAKDATVTIAHSQTPNLAAITRQADLLVVAVGKAGLITKEMVKPGAIVIDVGMNKDKAGKSCGDVDFPGVSSVAAYATPVPGGVGPMTVAMLMQNAVAAAGRKIG